MKIPARFISLFFVILSATAFAQESFSPYFVVIGAFKNEGNAQKYCIYAEEQNLPAVYALHEESRIYYVYVRATQTKDVADDILGRLKRNTIFRDAWVFNGKLSGSQAIPSKPLQRQEDTPEPVLESSEPVLVMEEAPPEKPVETPVHTPLDTPAQTLEEAPEETQSASVSPVSVETPKPVGRPFVFKLVNEETGDIVNGLVRLQETEKAQQFRGFNGNEKVYVPAPGNKSGKWFIVCNVLGFRQSKRPVFYDRADEFDGATIGADQEVIIPIALKRVRRGDYVEMEGVKFFNNSALFTPGSERELGELVAMMEDNPDYQIRLHGHTNGKASRDIVSLGKSTDLFNPDVSNEKSHASAKELSLLRAELVKTYLINNGVDASRIAIKGEGGAQMIYDPKGTLASLNDRVEIEIRKH